MKPPKPREFVVQAEACEQCEQLSLAKVTNLFGNIFGNEKVQIEKLYI